MQAIHPSYHTTFDLDLVMTNLVPKTFDAQATAGLLPYPDLVRTLREAIAEYAAGRIASPERLVVPMPDGGLMLSMPSCAEDLAVHKLVTVCPRNSEYRLPTIHGQVIACDAHTGELRFVLDGPTVTGRRTAAVTALGIMTLRASPVEKILIIGTGKQAANHVEAVATLFPRTTLLVKGRSDVATQRFVEEQRQTAPNIRALAGAIPENVDVVITVTTSKTPVYDQAPRKDRLLIGVGAFTPDAAEIGKQTVRASQVVVDDPAGAKHEAGDIIQAGYDWNAVSNLAQAIEGEVDLQAPLFFKSVGCAAWDLAACRVAQRTLG